MADSVFPESGNDIIDETALTKWLGRSNISGYVKSGLSITPDYTTPSVDISAGTAYIDDGDQDWYSEVDGRTGLGLTDAATNYIFLEYTAANDDDLSYHIDTDNSAPSNPNLLIAEVDTSNDTYTVHNRYPTVEFDTSSSRVSESVVQIGGSGAPYQSIQEAIDEHNRGTPGPHYHVQDGYDPTNESSFPIVVDHKCRISGDGSIIDVSSLGASENFMELNISGNRTPGITVDNLYIDGGSDTNKNGNHGFVAKSRFNRLLNLNIKHMGGDGIQVQQNDNGNAANTQNVIGCQIERCTGNGITAGSASNAHSMRIAFSQILECDGTGIYLDTVHNPVIFGTGIQLNLDDGIRIRGSYNPTIASTYFESNGSSTAQELSFFNSSAVSQECEAVTVRDCYFIDTDNDVPRAIHFASDSADGAKVESCNIRGHSTGVNVWDGNYDVDIDMPSMTFANVTTNVSADSANSVVMVNGVIGAYQAGVDLTLSNFNSGYPYLRAGQMAIHDGTDGGNTNTQGPAWYNGTDWISIVDNGTIA